MSEHRSVARWVTGLFLAGAAVMGVVAPAQSAQASTVSVGVAFQASADQHALSGLHDTGWD